uniref:Mitochondrial fission regulator 1 n=1 Tax=Mus musculus TaxID=10090 RepID=D6RFQ6_MOUSE
MLGWIKCLMRMWFQRVGVSMQSTRLSLNSEIHLPLPLKC